MRLWSLHPKYLDAQGLVALWREALLARAVLRGDTRGYRRHPQLERFRAHPLPLAAINTYLAGVHAEALVRGYAFDQSKIELPQTRISLEVTTGQVSYEWEQLLRKLAARSPECHERWSREASPQCHSLFVVQPGEVAPWERTSQPPAGR